MQMPASSASSEAIAARPGTLRNQSSSSPTTPGVMSTLHSW